MKRRIALLLALLLLCSAAACAATIRQVIPSQSVWGASADDFKRVNGGKYARVKVGKKTALVSRNVDVEGLTMDVYYVFGHNMRTYKGLSKVTCILSTSPTKARAGEAYDLLTDRVQALVGKKASSTKKNVSAWRTGDYEIEVGKGKFTAYNGSEKTNVGLTITFTDLPTPKPTPRPTPKPTKAPRPKKTPKPTSKPQVRTESTHSYVLNTKTRKFHYPTCSDVGNMNSENRQNYSGSRSQVIGMGYSPCGHCNP